MKFNSIPLILKIVLITAVMVALLVLSGVFGIIAGSSVGGINDLLQQLIGIGDADEMVRTIIWRIRFPRVVTAALAGAVLSLGGLVFQALLRNPLAEPYILGVSGGSAIGAIIGILLGFSRFPGVGLSAFAGSMATLVMVVFMSTGATAMKKDSVILSGVMVNAFCSAVIMFLISLSQDDRIHTIMFWLMGDLSSADMKQTVLLAILVVPCFILLFYLSNIMNLFMLGRDMAISKGVNIRMVSVVLLLTTSFMVSATVCQCGLLGFVGLVIPHIFRLMLGPDHRVLVPVCVFGGGAYMILCDLLARWLPKQGEMPSGVITAVIGAPIFILLLRKQQ